MVCSDANGQVSELSAKFSFDLVADVKQENYLFSVALHRRLHHHCHASQVHPLPAGCKVDQPGHHLVHQRNSKAHVPQSNLPWPPPPFPIRQTLIPFSFTPADPGFFPPPTVRRNPSRQRPSPGSLDRQKRFGRAIPHIKEPLQDGRPRVS